MSSPTPTLPGNGRVRCRVCLRYYQHGTGESRTARHLASRTHRGAAEQLGLDPTVEHAEPARCTVCGGIANGLRRHTATQRHRRAAAAAGLPPETVTSA